MAIQSVVVRSKQTNLNHPFVKMGLSHMNVNKNIIVSGITGCRYKKVDNRSKVNINKNTEILHYLGSEDIHKIVIIKVGNKICYCFKNDYIETFEKEPYYGQLTVEKLEAVATGVMFIPHIDDISNIKSSTEDGIYLLQKLDEDLNPSELQFMLCAEAPCFHYDF